ncbi:hypothetical protein PR202_ga26132 [Eleusine coracana subsp. coracana]|uniref:Uncharacterized protein n=1 Tax=Eleusine coracana subsp. coracana TaxID=191504 RepID=A0AAV5DB46_ELECO|nr:hypothetical protein PR202_ga26132 [Eleusine coracana subsp. coracana]
MRWLAPIPPRRGCLLCVLLVALCSIPGHSGAHESSAEVETKKASVAVIIIVSVLASVLVIIGLFLGYKYWQKRKRERDQARFLKLFEEGDDIDDELGLSNEL